MRKISFILVLLVSIFLVACGKTEVVGLQSDSGSLGSGVGSAPPSQPTSPPPYSSLEPPTKIKSNIDFSDIVWPQTMNSLDQRALELALNITGSFEGLESWTNITNNFDKQGMSLGLLSQNFGSGTLQPLLIQMRDQHAAEMARIFSKEHLLSLYAMLSDWQHLRPHFAEKIVSVFDLRVLATPEKNSVAWAQKNLYTDKAGLNFIPQWKAEFQSLAIVPTYKNLQFGEALNMHFEAKGYAEQTGVHQLRSYLMMFDVVDQNGDMPAEDFSDYQKFLAANPKATDDARLSQLVELRIRHVYPIYAEDVRSRKMAIVNGQGLVHTAHRNLELQYNFNRLEAY